MVSAEGEMDICQIEACFVLRSVQISLVFSCHMLMDAHVSIDSEGNVIF